MGEDRVVQDAQDHRHHHHEGQQRQVFATQEGGRAGADGVANLPHALIALVRADDPEGHEGRKRQGNYPGGQGYDD